MNTQRVLRIPRMELVIFALILLSAGGVAILITVVWPLVHAPLYQALNQADPWDVVNDFHVAINSNSVDDVLALFTNSATITDNKSAFNGKEHIRNWVSSSKRTAGLHLKMFHSEMDGEKIIWLDQAYSGPEEQNRYYIIRWEAVIVEGKIQSLIVTPVYLPDLK